MCRKRFKWINAKNLQRVIKMKHIRYAGVLICLMMSLVSSTSFAGCQISLRTLILLMALPGPAFRMSNAVVEDSRERNHPGDYVVATTLVDQINMAGLQRQKKYQFDNRLRASFDKASSAVTPEHRALMETVIDDKSHYSDDVKKAAISALVRQERTPPDLIEYMQKVATDPAQSFVVRDRAITALGEKSRIALDSVPLLITNLGDPIFYSSSFSALLKFKGAVESPLVEALRQSPSEKTRMNAAVLLTALPELSKKTSEALTKALRDPSPDVREALAYGVVSMKDKSDSLPLILREIGNPDPGANESLETQMNYYGPVTDRQLREFETLAETTQSQTVRERTLKIIEELKTHH